LSNYANHQFVNNCSLIPPTGKRERERDRGNELEEKTYIRAQNVEIHC
jgi:hypothetical protein